MDRSNGPSSGAAGAGRRGSAVTALDASGGRRVATDRARDGRRIGPAHPHGPWHDGRVTDQGERYDRIAEGYARWWAPVLAPAVGRAARRRRAAPRRRRRTCSTSGRAPVSSASAAVERWPDVSVVGIDASAEMRAMADAEADRRLTDGQRPRFSSVRGRRRPPAAGRRSVRRGASRRSSSSSSRTGRAPCARRAASCARMACSPTCRGSTASGSATSAPTRSSTRCSTSFDFDPAEGDDRQRRHPVGGARGERAAPRRVRGRHGPGRPPGAPVHGRWLHRLPHRVRRGIAVRRARARHCATTCSRTLRTRLLALSPEQMTMRARSCSRPAAGRADGAGHPAPRRSALAATPRRRPRRRPPRPPRPRQLRPRRPRRTDDDRLFLDARRLDLGDDLVAVGQQRHVGRDRRGRGRGWWCRSRPATRSSTRSTAAGDPAARGPGRTRSGGAACRPGASTAGDSPVATSGTSTVSSSVIRTRNRSTWSVRRLTGWTWTLETRTGRAFLPSTDRSTRAFGPMCRRSCSNSWASIEMLSESMPWP